MTRHLVWLVALLALLSTHCNERVGPPDSEPVAGTGKLALRTADAEYRLVGTLNLERQSGERGVMSLPLDGQEELVTFTLPVGSYQATLAAGWNLLRLSTGTDLAELVTAVELTPMPVVVTSGETTKVTIAITLSDDEIVVLGPGAIEVVLEVDAGTPACGCSPNETCLALGDGSHRCVAPCSPAPGAPVACADGRECRLAYFTRNGDALEPLYVCSEPIPGDPAGGTGGTAGAGSAGGTAGSGGAGGTSAGVAGGAPEPEPPLDTTAASPLLMPATYSQRRGPENTAIPLEIHAALTDTDGSETLAVVIERVDAGEIQGAVLSDGTRSFTFSAGNASVDVSDWNLAAITARQITDSDADLFFNVKARSTESNGGATTEVVVRVDVLVITEGSGAESNQRLYELPSIAGATLRLEGPRSGEGFGRVVNGGGDFNGDGFSDIVVGSPFGLTFVVFGSASGLPSPVDVDQLDGSTGFRLDGWAPGNAAGDLDGDGFDDLVVVDHDSTDRNLVVLYGHAPPFPPVAEAASGAVVLQSLPNLIHDVTTADTNGDGFDDVIVATTYGVIVLYGGASRFTDWVNLFGEDGALGLDGAIGSVFVGRSRLDSYGAFTVESAGDVNGDGFEDLIVGDAPEGFFGPGAAYVVFGRPGGFGAASLDLRSLDGTNGFKLEATTHAGSLGIGTTVSTAGDFNADGFDDVIVGASNSTARDDLRAGASYLVFGHAGSFPATVDLSALNGADGFRADGAEAFDEFGSVVSAAGDVNGDGFDDVIAASAMAALWGYRGPPGNLGESYVLYGRASETSSVQNLASLAADAGTRLEGGGIGQVPGAGGDINGDGLADFLLGTPHLGVVGTEVFRGSANAIFGGTLVRSDGPRLQGSGTPGDDVLVTPPGENNLLLAFAGNDRLDGSGGDDILLAGPGNDVLVYQFGARLSGGPGFDTLEIPGDLDLTGLPIAQLRAITGIEVFDLRNGVVGELVWDQRAFLHVVREATAVASAPGLVIRGDEFDIVRAGSGWTLNGTAVLDGTAFDVYSPAGRSPLLWIEQSIESVEVLP